MKHLLLVFLGGGIGASARHLVTLFMLRHFGSGFPWGTFAVNVLGSFVMGLFIALLARATGTFQDVRVLVATGMLGGFTTFSSFSLDTAFLYERGEIGLAAAYVIATVTLSIVALFTALWLVRGVAG